MKGRPSRHRPGAGAHGGSADGGELSRMGRFRVNRFTSILNLPHLVEHLFFGRCVFDCHARHGRPSVFRDPTPILRSCSASALLTSFSDFRCCRLAAVENRFVVSDAFYGWGFRRVALRTPASPSRIENCGPTLIAFSFGSLSGSSASVGDARMVAHHLVECPHLRDGFEAIIADRGAREVELPSLGHSASEANPGAGRARLVLPAEVPDREPL